MSDMQLSAKELPISSIKFYCDENGNAKVLGRGGFGNVYSGMYNKEAAAIKAVHNDSPDHQVSLFNAHTNFHQYHS